MSPEASPGEVSPNAGVRRVNNLPVYIIGGLMTVFLIVMVLVAADRADQQHRQSDAKDEKTGNTSMFANEIAGIQQEGIIQAEPAQPLIVPEQPHIIVARPENLEAPPTPPLSDTNPHRNDELERIRMAKMQQFEAAIKAKTEVQVTAPRSVGSTPGGKSDRSPPTTRDEAITQLAALRQQIDAQTHDDPTASYKAHMQQLQAAWSETTGGNTAPRLIQTANESNKSKDLGQFADSGHGDRWKLDAQPEAPRTPYELRAGFVVPGTLISGINSELPGQIMAQVAQNVYDTPTGKHLLLPQGSRLIGSYSSDVSYGQARVSAAFDCAPSRRVALRAAFAARPDEAPDHRGVLQRLESYPQSRRGVARRHTRHPPSFGHGHRQLGYSGEGGHDAHRAQDGGDVHALRPHRGWPRAAGRRTGGEPAQVGGGGHDCHTSLCILTVIRL